MTQPPKIPDVMGTTPQYIFVVVQTPQDQIDGEGTVSKGAILPVPAGGNQDDVVRAFIGNAPIGSIVYTGDPSALTQYQITSALTPQPIALPTPAG